jgi:geranylgeranyl reductase family protein
VFGELRQRQQLLDVQDVVELKVDLGAAWGELRFGREHGADYSARAGGGPLRQESLFTRRERFAGTLAKAYGMRVAIVGAGPAGSAAAIALARGGVHVTLLEKARWPRAKTCGDGVTPDGIRALLELGVELPSGAPQCPDATVVSPRGTRAVGRWNGIATVIPRIELDAAMVTRAVACGADFRDATHVREARPDGTIVTETGEQHFDAIVLAEGATGGLAARLGFGDFDERQVAIRGYAEARVPLRPTYNVVYDAAFATGGYGWIFPVAERRANLGVCVSERIAQRHGGPRELLRAWLARDPLVRELFGESVELEDVRGGVIPTGRTLRRAGCVYAVGDAAGVADPLSAEGISQAIETGVAAANALLGEAAAFAASLRAHDRNAREARRLRALFRFTLDPMIALAAKRPALADHLVASGFTQKTDGHWFHGVRGALLRG